MQKWQGFPQLVNGDMSASFNSVGSLIREYDNIGPAYSWTGTPTGVLKLQVSNDSTDGNDGTWNDLPGVTFSAQPAGGAGNCIATGVTLTPCAFNRIRTVYTRTSGTGTLAAPFMGKAV